MIPDINSFWEFMAYWSAGGFICGRHMAGLAYEDGKKALDGWNTDRYRRNYDRPNPPARTFWAFVGGYLAWPVLYVGWATAIGLDKVPGRAWKALQYVFVKPPPRRIRKERKLAELQEKTAKLEKELQL